MTTYPGGKSGSGVYQKLINLMPKHSAYVEPFLGGGAVMKYKKPAPIANIAIDADAAVIHKFSPAGIWNYQGIVTNSIEWLQAAEIVRNGDTLIYCDPPYLMSTRRIQDRPIYRCELCEADHVRLLEILKGLQCMVMVSGYPSDLYDAALRGWRRISFMAMTRGGSMAQEVVWMNFPEPFELHDYRYLGRDFRERERIKRKISRWKNKLRNMDPVERAALMTAIEQVRFPDPIAKNAGTADIPGTLAGIDEAGQYRPL